MKTFVTIPKLREQLIEYVKNASNEAEYRSHKLILLMIPADSRTVLEADLKKNGIDIINVSRKLSQKLVSLSINQRIKHLEEEVSEIVSNCNEFTWLSKLDLLCDPSLNSDPIILLKMVAKSQVVVAIWPGDITETSVVYSKPGKPDYKSYLLKELNDIQVIKACNGVIK